MSSICTHSRELALQLDPLGRESLDLASSLPHSDQGSSRGSWPSRNAASVASGLRTGHPGVRECWLREPSNLQPHLSTHRCLWHQLHGPPNFPNSASRPLPTLYRELSRCPPLLAPCLQHQIPPSGALPSSCQSLRKFQPSAG